MLWTFVVVAVISDFRVRRCRVLLLRWFLLLLWWIQLPVGACAALAVLDEGIQVGRRFPCDQVSMRTPMKQDGSARED